MWKIRKEKKRKKRETEGRESVRREKRKYKEGEKEGRVRCKYKERVKEGRVRWWKSSQWHLRSAADFHKHADFHF